MNESTWLLQIDSDDELDDKTWTTPLTNAVRACFLFCTCADTPVVASTVFCAHVFNRLMVPNENRMLLRLNLVISECQEIDDFMDVEKRQKRFFKLWNEFRARATTPLPVHSLPRTCLNFVKENALVLKQEIGMEEELICHLSNLYDEGVLGSVHVAEIMSTYNALLDRIYL